MVLEALIEDGNALAAYATVSKEWQVIFERHNFARIKVTPSRLPDLDRIVRRNQASVRYLWLCLELEKYGCSRCGQREMEIGGAGDYREVSREDNIRIIKAMRIFFQVLSKWEAASNIVLDISVYSPSDSDHHFKYLTFEPDAPASEWEQVHKRLMKHAVELARAHDHFWDPDCPDSILALSCLDLVFGRIMDGSEGPFINEEQEFKWWMQLPNVPAVTGVLLRQQTRRRWRPAALAVMLCKFTELQEIHYEPWREWGDDLQEITDPRKLEH